MKSYLFLVICLSSLSGCYNLRPPFRQFFQGRRYGGNLGSPDKAVGASQYERWFTQNLDHFNPSDERTWQQRYFVNDQFASTKRNVAFLFIGGEGEANVRWMENGNWISYAKEFQAMCFMVEHRYYGQSRPTENISTDNLQYLTSQQALADLAVIVEMANTQYNLTSDVKWIVFGGSYAGALSAWFRMKYPHLIHGAVASSAPIQAKVNFKEYLGVVADDLNATSQSCAATVQQAFAQLPVLLKNATGQAYVTRLFGLCDPIEQLISDEKEHANFYTTLAYYIAFVAQYNLDGSPSGVRRTLSLNTLCDVLNNETIGTEVERLAAMYKIFTGDEYCLDYNYGLAIEAMRNESWDSTVADGTRQWVYQTCTEFGYYQTSDSKPHIFGNRITEKFYTDQCIDVYGDQYNGTFVNGAIHRTNTIYGGKKIDVSNVVFVHGSFDPWHPLGITKTRQKHAPAIYINGTAHCADTYPALDDDLPQLVAARLKAKQIVASWLKQ